MIINWNFFRKDVYSLKSVKELIWYMYSEYFTTYKSDYDWQNINDINEYYNTKYSKRAEQNKIVKTMSAKMGDVDLNVNEEDVKTLENECNELESKIKKQNDKNDFDSGGCRFPERLRHE